MTAPDYDYDYGLTEIRDEESVWWTDLLNRLAEAFDADYGFGGDVDVRRHGDDVVIAIPGAGDWLVREDVDGIVRNDDSLYIHRTPDGTWYQRGIVWTDTNGGHLRREASLDIPVDDDLDAIVAGLANALHQDPGVPFHDVDTGEDAS